MHDYPGLTVAPDDGRAEKRDAESSHTLERLIEAKHDVDLLIEKGHRIVAEAHDALRRASEKIDRLR